MTLFIHILECLQANKVVLVLHRNLNFGKPSHITDGIRKARASEFSPSMFKLLFQRIKTDTSLDILFNSMFFFLLKPLILVFQIHVMEAHVKCNLLLHLHLLAKIVRLLTMADYAIVSI